MAAQNPWDASRPPAGAAEINPMDVLRVNCYRLSIALLVVAILQIFCFWAVWWFPGLLIIFSAFVSITGFHHFQSEENLMNNTCVAEPVEAIKLFSFSGVAVAVGGLIISIGSLVAAISTDDDTLKVFAIGSLIVSACYVPIGILMFKWGQTLHSMCLATAAVQRHVAPGVVLQAQPIDLQYPAPGPNQPPTTTTTTTHKSAQQV